MVFSWSPVWGKTGGKVALNKFPIIVIPKRLQAVFLGPAMHIVVQV
jgi:hypothetical protein